MSKCRGDAGALRWLHRPGAAHSQRSQNTANRPGRRNHRVV